MELFDMASFVSKYLIQANMILTSCILVVFAVRFLVRKYSRIFSYGAWGIVCFGLVYFFVSPLQLPLHAAYSFLSGKSGQKDTSLAADTAGTQTSPDGAAAVNDLSASPAVPEGGETAGHGLTDKIAAISPDFLQIPHPEGWLREDRSAQILFCVWFAGALILLIHFLSSYIRVKRTTRFAIKLRENIFELDGYMTPFVFGVFHAKIYIPYGLKEEEISLIVTHEQCHIRYRHHIVLLLAKLIRILFWANPFVWIAYRKLSLDMEMLCDEHATKKLGISEKKEYSLLLAQMASKGKIIDAVYFSSRASVLKKRVKNILENKKGNIILPVGILISCLIVVAAGTGAYAAANGNPLWNNEDGETPGVTASEMRNWFGTSIAKIMSDEQVESLAQQLLTVIGDSQTADGVTVTLDAAMRDEGRILLAFTVEGDRKLTPSAGRLECEKSGIYPYLTKEELKKILPDVSDQEIEEYLAYMKEQQESGDYFLKGYQELTAFEGEDGSQHMLMQLDTSSDVEIFDVHLQDFGGIPGPFDFRITVPVKGEPLVYTGSIPFMAAGNVEMTLTKVTVRPMSGVSAELVLSDSTGTLPENDQEFNESITVDMVRWNGMEAGNSSTARYTEGNTVATTMRNYAGKAITPEDVTAVKIGSRWIELDQMTPAGDSSAAE